MCSRILNFWDFKHFGNINPPQYQQSGNKSCSRVITLAARWRRWRAMPLLPSTASGRRSGCSRTGRRRSSSRPIRCSSRRCATSSGSISTRRNGRSCCASTRSPRSRRSTAMSRSRLGRVPAARGCPTAPALRNAHPNDPRGPVPPTIFA